jgi:hypothetical protein
MWKLESVLDVRWFCWLQCWIYQGKELKQRKNSEAMHQCLMNDFHWVFYCELPEFFVFQLVCYKFRELLINYLCILHFCYILYKDWFGWQYGLLAYFGKFLCKFQKLVLTSPGLRACFHIGSKETWIFEMTSVFKW